MRIFKSGSASGVLSVILAAGIFSGSAFALDPRAMPTAESATAETSTKIDAKFKRTAALEKVEIPAAKAEVEAVRKNSSIRTEEAREQLIANAEAKVAALQDELRKLNRTLQATGKKARKIDRDADKIAENDKKVAELQALKAGKSADEVAILNVKIQGYNEDSDRLRARIERKEIAYGKKAGEKIQESRAVKTTPSPSPIASEAPKTLTDDEKRGIDGCWTKSIVPVGKPVVAFYALGKDEIPDGASVGDSKRLEELFEKNADEIRKSLYDGGFGKIAKIESQSSASLVRGKSKSPEQLAEGRSRNANSRFTALLKLKNTENGPHIEEMKSFDSRVNRTDQIAMGPKWVPTEYAKLSKMKVSDAALTKAAEAVLENNDYTPVKVTEGSYVERLRGTKENLRKCCDMNAATLKYQPYQFTVIEVYGAKFAPSAETCVRDSGQIAGQTSPKSTAGENTSNQACSPGDNDYYDCLDRASRAKGAAPVKKSGTTQ